MWVASRRISETGFAWIGRCSENTSNPRDVSLARRLEWLSHIMLVRDLMVREVTTLKASESLGLADDIMQLGRIRHLPVLSGGVLVGIVSQRDLYRAGMSSMLRIRRSAEREWLACIPVRDVMTTDVVTVAPDETIHAAVELMLRHRIGCLPVVEHGKLVGLVSETDCLHHLARVLGVAEAKAGLPELSQ